MTQDQHPQDRQDHTPIPTTHSCDDYDPNSLPPDVALAHILDTIDPLRDTETVATAAALGRILAAPIRSAINVPPHDNSAMDGYAVRHADVDAPGSPTLTVIGASFAGKPYVPDSTADEKTDTDSDTGKSNTAIRIMTGAVMPAGYDAVVMQEHVQIEGDQITLDTATRPVRAGQSVRKTGEDIQAGDEILPAGRHITAADMGLIASVGIPEIRVFRPLKVAFFSTGDELQQIDQPLAAGEIYDSNRYTLRGMISRLGVQEVDIIDLGVIPDDPAAIEQAFQRAASQADAIISSGGVSVGEADYTKTILDSLGQVRFWKVAMKPGRPLAYGHVEGKPFFGLPGNPVSVMVTFYQFVQPALLKLRGENAEPPLTLSVKAANRFRKRPGRREYQRAILKSENGELQVHGTGDQGSGILTTMSQANCFVILATETATIEAGEMVTVQPFAGLV